MSLRKQFLQGLYKHYKGKEYQTICLAKSSENPKNIFVIYQAMYKDDIGNYNIWVRSLDDFLDNVEINGEIVERFVYLENHLK